jgi:alkanesulfonate monooxygenase SsuD/methylene tetrahydromethanopterin reductase-like flavin-dependent oxidoreductase (luciferase family)
MCKAVSTKAPLTTSANPPTGHAQGCPPAPAQIGFGVLLPLFGSSWPEVREIALRAEAAGYDDVWISDHLMALPDPATTVLEGWTTLAALAAVTERVTLGTLVLASTFRQPLLLAKAVETLASIAGPRLLLGLGAGWLEAEHRAFGLEFPPLAERVARLEATIDAVRERTPELELLVGGAGSRTIDLAVRKADWWNAPGDRLDELPALIERMRARGREEGREPRVASRVGVLLGDEPGEAEARLARRSSPWTRIGLGPLGLVGDDDEIARRIELHRSLGVSRIVIGCSRRDMREGVLERLAERVLSRFR